MRVSVGSRDMLFKVDLPGRIQDLYKEIEKHHVALEIYQNDTGTTLYSPATFLSQTKKTKMDSGQI
jgi:hypothetical protein